MKKKVAILASVGIKIPPRRQGGIEHIVYGLAEGLVKNGYSVLVFGPETTKTSAKLIPVGKVPVSKFKPPKEAESSRKLRYELAMLSKMIVELKKRKKEIGIIFNHTIHGGLLAPLEKILKIPVFHILHLPLFSQIAEIYKFFNSKLISISNNQRKAFPNLNYQKTIYNGVKLESFPFSKKPKDYFLFAGKIRPSKGTREAILAAKKAKVKLYIVGKISDKNYYQKRIKPLIDRKNIFYFGEVHYRKLIDFYKGAKALLFPIKWEEPFGLVQIEAGACGTPVIAFRRGAVLEVIKDGVNGFVVENLTEMVKAIKRIDLIKRENCRELVKEKFSIEKMVKDYQQLCQRYIQK